MTNTKPTIPRWLIYGTITAGAVLFSAFTVFNPPQCPDTYTQEQIDASNCIVGANIGLGLLMLFLWPLLATLALLWVLFLVRLIRKK